MTLIPLQDTGKTFFRLLIFLSIAFGILGGILQGLIGNIGLMVFIFLDMVVYLAINRLELEKIDLWVLPVFAVGVVVLVLGLGEEGEISMQAFLNLFLSALLLGASLFSMVLGHWYLIRPRLSFRHLVLGCLVFLGLSVLRMGEVGFALFLRGEGSWTKLFYQAGDILFLSRFLWGGLLPIFFLIFAYQCAKIHSNRSTTGILYFTTASVFMGELMAGYLTRMCAMPL